jgi:MFS family permease
VPFFSIHPLRRARQSLRDLRTGIGDGPFGALRHPDFRRFIAGQGISLIGTWMQTIAQGWLVLDLTHSAFAVGLATTLATLPVLLFTLYGGVVADRVDRRKFVMFLQGVMMTEAGVMAGLALTHHITMPWIYGLVLVFGLATAFEVPTRQAFLVELVPREDLISAAALNSTNYNLARVIGPAIAGVIIAVAGVGAAFALNAVSYVAVLIAFARIKGPARPTGPAASPSILTGVRFIAARAGLAALNRLMVLLTIFVVSFVPMLPVYGLMFP